MYIGVLLMLSQLQSQLMNMLVVSDDVVLRQETAFIIITSSSHGENGSRPQRPLYPRNNDKVHFILHKILYYNNAF